MSETGRRHCWLFALVGTACSAPPAEAPLTRPAPQAAPSATLDPCADDVTGTRTEQLEPRIELGRLAAAAEAMTEPGAIVRLGRIEFDPFAPIVTRSKLMHSPAELDLGPTPMPTEAVAALLPSVAGARYLEHERTRAALRDAFTRHRTGARDLCIEARRAQLDIVRASLMRELAASELPIARLVRGELLLNEGVATEDPAQAALTLESAALLLRSARDAADRQQLVGYFARMRLAEVELARGNREAARTAARSLVGIRPPESTPPGDAELRAAELEDDPAERRRLFKAAIAAAPESSLVHLAAVAGLLASLIDEGAHGAALELSAQVARMPDATTSAIANALAAGAYAKLLPNAPLWWRLPLPAVSRSDFATIADRLADETERRGDVELARRLREQALTADPSADSAQHVRAKLAKMRPADFDREALRARVQTLFDDCHDGPGKLTGSLLLTFDGERLGARDRLRGESAADVRACLNDWGVTYLRGAPPLEVELSSRPRASHQR